MPPTLIVPKFLMIDSAVRGEPASVLVSIFSAPPIVSEPVDKTSSSGIDVPKSVK